MEYQDFHQVQSDINAADNHRKKVGPKMIKIVTLATASSSCAPDKLKHYQDEIEKLRTELHTDVDLYIDGILSVFIKLRRMIFK